MTRTSRCVALSAAGLVLCLAAPADGQVPPRPTAAAPDTYQARFRYEIDAPPRVRVGLFQEMTRYLESIGFRADLAENFDLAPYDRSFTRMSGTIPAANAARLLFQASRGGAG